MDWQDADLEQKIKTNFSFSEKLFALIGQSAANNYFRKTS